MFLIIIIDFYSQII